MIQPKSGMNRVVACVLALTFGELSATLPAVAQCRAHWLPGRGISGADGSVSALAATANGDCVLSAPFAVPGESPRIVIARYNPITGALTHLGSVGGDAVTAAVKALVVLPNGDLIAAGNFTLIGGVSANSIALYRESTGTWTPLGLGIRNGAMAGNVNAIVVLPSGDLIIAGEFTMAGHKVASNAARYSPATGLWSSIGDVGFGVSVLALRPNGEVMAGSGPFASYNPATNAWTSLAPVLAPPFEVLTALVVLPDGDAVVSGYSAPPLEYPQPGRQAILMRYSASTNTWANIGQPIGGGSDGASLTSLAVLSGGDIIVGGDFTVETAGLPNSYIVRYSPDTGGWSALGVSVNDTVEALAFLRDGDLVAGGMFTIAGGKSSAFLGEYTFGVPAPSITTQPQGVTVCTAGTTAFTVTASGTVALDYTWQWQPQGASAGGAWVDVVPGPNKSPRGGASGRPRPSTRTL